jgi:fumarylacetoacetate (FAA) hydrolase
MNAPLNAPAWRVATRRNGRRDGELMLVRPDGAAWVALSSVAPTLQALLDDWPTLAPRVTQFQAQCEAAGWSGAQRLDSAQCMAPLPRAFQWVDASVYRNHARLMYQWRKEPIPARYETEPLVYQGGSDILIGPTDPIEAVDEAHGVDLEAEIAVITTDVPMGTRADQALDHIALVVLLNDVSLRGLIPDELSRGFGFYQSKPATSFAPVAVTPGALGAAWKDGMADLRMDVALNGEWFGSPRTAEETVFHFGQILEHLARTRHLGAGTIVGAGTISNASQAVGNACITEARVRALLAGRPEHELRPYLRDGDRVTIRAVDAQGRDVFGTIDQRVVVRRPEA